jgi:hypothetical protein
MRRIAGSVGMLRAPRSALINTVLGTRGTHGIPGVFAMDNALYREVARKSGYDQNVLQQVFEEAERRRARGETHTTSDYMRDHDGKS